jgi:SAM-dependent methyltransferase
VHQSHATKNGPDAVGHEDACARVAARFRERWLRSYAWRKLRSDPIFPAAFELLRESGEPLLDVGCGVGLLAFYLRERNYLPPISGLDRDGRKIARANTVTKGVYLGLDFIEQDICDPIAQTGNIVLFDLLHYLCPDDQTRLLARLATRIAPGGLLLIRDCPRDGNLRYWLTHLAERFAQATTWNVKTSLHFPTRENIFAAFDTERVSGTDRPLWGSTPFNNYLFVFRRRAAAALPAGAGCSDSSTSSGR